MIPKAKLTASNLRMRLFFLLCRSIVILALPPSLLLLLVFIITVIRGSTKGQNDLDSSPLRCVVKFLRIELLIFVGTCLLVFRFGIQILSFLLQKFATSLDMVCEWIPLTNIEACY